MPRIKICGLKRKEDIVMVNKYLPDYAGFVFAGQKRRITAEQAGEFKEMLDKQIKAVGVFVNEPLENIVEMLERGIIDLAQLHGDETEQDIRYIKKVTGKKVIKAVSVTSPADVTKWKDSMADYLLFDNGAGGTGQKFNWEMIENCGRPFFLAGGINPDNVGAAEQYNPYCIDVSSGVETDGVKDKEKVKKIISLIRNI